MLKLFIWAPSYITLLPLLFVYNKASGLFALRTSPHQYVSGMVLRYFRIWAIDLLSMWISASAGPRASQRGRHKTWVTVTVTVTVPKALAMNQRWRHFNSTRTQWRFKGIFGHSISPFFPFFSPFMFSHADVYFPLVSYSCDQLGYYWFYWKRTKNRRSILPFWFYS